MDLLPALLVLGTLVSAPAGAETVGVTVRARVEMAGTTRAHDHNLSADKVVWLSRRAGSAPSSAPAATPGHFRMEQKNKSFHPHLLVVPLGSSVEFPNLDPFFHNVFSQFNGKRFDLGLYEAGSTRTVRFDHEGVSYLFCNIHSSMAAVIVTLATPYFAISDESGSVKLHHVLPGDYEMHVWAEGEAPTELTLTVRSIHVGTTDIDSGNVRIAAPKTLPAHKNKYGEDYPPEHTPTYQ